MHKTITTSQSLDQPSYSQATTPSSLYSGRQLAPRGSTSWKLPRSTPYPRARGRGGRMSSTHRNRVLILNNPTDPIQNIDSQSSPGIPETKEGSSKEGASGSASWVSKLDRHMQLINTSIYDKEKQLRRKAMNETVRKKALAEEHREKARIAKHLQSINNYPGKSTAVPTSTGLMFQIQRILRQSKPILAASFFTAARMATSIDRGSSKRRRNTMKEKSVNSAYEESDLSSDEGDYDEIDSDDVDSDGMEEHMIDAPDHDETHALSQQQDFVKF
ncbi:MAG: hypothetical protein Q9195_002014 [Heterodermia aff. obscurata]